MVRGMRTLAIRLERQGAAALEIAKWLAKRPEVKRVLHPALESDPGHALWKRDFKGASRPLRRGAAAVHAASRWPPSWTTASTSASATAGAASRASSSPRTCATAGRCGPGTAGPLIRLHIGLEDPADLMADLDVAFARWRAAA